MSVDQPVYLRKFNGLEYLPCKGAAGQVLPLKETREVGAGFKQHVGPKGHKQNGIDLRLECSYSATHVMDVAHAAGYCRNISSMILNCLWILRNYAPGQCQKERDERRIRVFSLISQSHDD